MAFGNTRPLVPMKVCSPSSALKSRKQPRRKRLDGAPQMRLRRAVALQKLRQVLRMREVQPAASGHQEFAAGRRHRVIDDDRNARARNLFSRHQACRAGADDRAKFWGAHWGG